MFGACYMQFTAQVCALTFVDKDTNNCIHSYVISGPSVTSSCKQAVINLGQHHICLLTQSSKTPVYHECCQSQSQMWDKQSSNLTWKPTFGVIHYRDDCDCDCLLCVVALVRYLSHFNCSLWEWQLHVCDCASSLWIHPQALAHIFSSSNTRLLYLLQGLIPGRCYPIITGEWW